LPTWAAATSPSARSAFARSPRPMKTGSRRPGSDDRIVHVAGRPAAGPGDRPARPTDRLPRLVRCREDVSLEMRALASPGRCGSRCGIGPRAWISSFAGVSALVPDTLALTRLRERRGASSVRPGPHARRRRAYAPHPLRRAASRACCSSVATAPLGARRAAASASKRQRLCVGDRRCLKQLRIPGDAERPPTVRHRRRSAPQRSRLRVEPNRERHPRRTPVAPRARRAPGSR